MHLNIWSLWLIWDPRDCVDLHLIYLFIYLSQLNSYNFIHYNVCFNIDPQEDYYSVITLTLELDMFTFFVIFLYIIAHYPSLNQIL